MRRYLIAAVCMGLLAESAVADREVAAVRLAPISTTSEHPADQWWGDALGRVLSAAIGAFGEYIGAVEAKWPLPVSPEALGIAPGGVASHAVEGIAEVYGGIVVVHVWLRDLRSGASREWEFTAPTTDIAPMLGDIVVWLAEGVGGSDDAVRALAAWVPTAFPRTAAELREWLDEPRAARGRFGLATLEGLSTEGLVSVAEAFPGHLGVRLPRALPRDPDRATAVVEAFAAACAVQAASPAVRVSSADLVRASARIVRETIAQAPVASVLMAGMREAARLDTTLGPDAAILAAAERDLNEAILEAVGRGTLWQDLAPPDLESDPALVAYSHLALSTWGAESFALELGSNEGLAQTLGRVSSAREQLQRLSLPPGWHALGDTIADWMHGLVLVVSATRDLWAPWLDGFPLARACAAYLPQGALPPVLEVTGAALAEASDLDLGPDERAGLAAWRAGCLLRCGLYDEALAVVRAGRAVDSKSVRLLEIGYYAHLCRGDTASAAGALTAMLEALPPQSDAAARWREARAALLAGTLPSALPPGLESPLSHEGREWLGVDLGDVRLASVHGSGRGSVALLLRSPLVEGVRFAVAERAFLVDSRGRLFRVRSPMAVDAGPVGVVVAPEFGGDVSPGRPSRLLVRHADGYWLSVPAQPAGGFPAAAGGEARGPRRPRH